MKYLVLAMLTVLPLGACADVSETISQPIINQKLPDEVQEVLRYSVDNLVFVKGGSFQMGDIGAYITRESFNEGPLGSYEFVDEDHPDAIWIPWVFQVVGEKRTAEPVHKVTLPSYSIGKYEVTFKEYDAYTRDKILPDLHEDRPDAHFRKPDRPAIGVTWNEAHNYCQWLADKTGVAFSLPTEAQWEYAARSRGNDVAYGTDSGMPEKDVNIPSGLGTKRVGSYPPNPLGLFDMSGNAKEWIRDWFDPDYYKKSPGHNPKGPKNGTERVIRSGDVILQRYHRAPDYRGYTLGFRCAVNQEEPVAMK